MGNRINVVYIITRQQIAIIHNLWWFQAWGMF